MAITQCSRCDILTYVIFSFKNAAEFYSIFLPLASYFVWCNSELTTLKRAFVHGRDLIQKWQLAAINFINKSYNHEQEPVKSSNYLQPSFRAVGQNMWNGRHLKNSKIREKFMYVLVSPPKPYCHYICL